ncbi:four helix bundle protein [uncultured Maribacter sp.]
MGRKFSRQSVSLPSNVSDGTSKSSDKHFTNYLEHSLGFAFEREVQLKVT